MPHVLALLQDLRGRTPGELSWAELQWVRQLLTLVEPPTPRPRAVGSRAWHWGRPRGGGSRDA